MTRVQILLFLYGIQTIAPIQGHAAGQNWMAAISDATPLTALSVPGSHDSCAWHEPLPGTAKCQSLGIEQQLKAGVRFLDIRCRNNGTAFDVYHGAYSQGISFGQVLAQVTQFLRANATETVIMSVKEENSRTGGAFEAVFKTYLANNPNIWHIGAQVPTLGTARGKIVLFRRFGGSGGIDAGDWPDNATFTRGQIRVEDEYKVTNLDKKWTQIEAHLRGARASSAASWYLTFASGYTPELFGIPNISAVSNVINGRLKTCFQHGDKGHYGIIPMDFVDPAICSEIIATNFL